MSKAEIEDSYKISRRIEGEERALDYATMVFTSTQQEVMTVDLHHCLATAAAAG
jgi:hypothetical protein